MSDKRLLRRYGSGKSNLNGARTGSIRPSGLHVRRAEARENGLRSRIPGKSPETGNVLSAVESQGFRKEELRQTIF